MRRTSLFAAALLVPSLLAAQQASTATAETIIPAPATTLPRTLAPRPTKPGLSADDLMTRLYIFAADSMMGREAGTRGNVMGTDYIAAEVKRLGLLPAGENGTYFQTLPLKETAIDTTSTLAAGGGALAYGTEWLPLGNSSLTGTGVPIVYGGKLGDSTQISSEAAAGKLVVMLVPLSNAAIGQAIQGTNLVPKSAAGAALLLPAPVLAQLRQYLESERSISVDDGASATRLFVATSAVSKFFDKPLNELELGTAGGTAEINAIIMATPIEHPARNVIAMLPGSDPKLKTQYVAIGAHNDHVGMSAKPVDHDSLRILTHLVRPGGAEDGGKNATSEQQAQINAELAEWRSKNEPRLDSIFNGADDDGSGSVAVLEIAEYLASQKVKPKRSTLFVWHVGEEKGLWGSKWFTDNPTVPRDSIVAQLNIDMIGRGDAWDRTGQTKDRVPLQGSPDYLQVIGSRRLSTELGEIVDQVNTSGKHNLALDYAMDANGHPMNIYCRSDHYEYARYGIPIAFFSTGGHSDYHQLTDEPQYIDYPHMLKVVRYITSLAQAVGNLDHRPLVDQPLPDPNGSCQQ